VEFDVKFFVQEVLNLLFLPRFTVFKKLKKTLALIFAKLRGMSVPEVRRELPESIFVPALRPEIFG
jgi:hypothetical protein